MAGIGQAPNPDSTRQRSPFGWTELPAAGRSGPVPDLPHPPPWLAELDGWPVSTRAAWRGLWETLQATQWDQTGKSLHDWAMLHAKASIDGPTPAMTAEMRQHTDRHGLNPAALMRLRWRIVADVAEAPTVPASRTKKASGLDRMARALKVVADGEKEAGY